MQLNNIVHLESYPIDDSTFTDQCKQQLDTTGALVLNGFLTSKAIEKIVTEGVDNQHLAFYSTSSHNVYLRESDPSFPADHVRNLLVNSSKGCITDDQIPEDSPLRMLYDSSLFRTFLAKIFGEQQLHNYADKLSSINLHYASEDQELGWHFDESSFAITLLLQPPQAGGNFEYVENMRDADKGEMNFAGVADVLSGKTAVKALQAQAGTLSLFRGRNAMHRVTPTQGDTTRMLVVLAYNSQPDVALSESARMTFYGRM
ncbi:MAG: 2OG-Fe(II) oxygenase [Oceanospirillaceae bacterium]